MGISIDWPVRLSVIVTESGTRATLPLLLVAVDARVPYLEAQLRVEPVGGLAGRAGREVERACAGLVGQADGLGRERLSHPPAPGRLVDDHVFDPTPDPGRDAEQHERERAHDRALGSGQAGDQEAGDG